MEIFLLIVTVTLFAAPLVILAVIPSHILFNCPESCPCRKK